MNRKGYSRYTAVRRGLENEFGDVYTKSNLSDQTYTEVNICRSIEDQLFSWTRRGKHHDIVKRAWLTRATSKCDALACVRVPVPVSPEELQTLALSPIPQPSSPQSKPNQATIIKNVPRALANDFHHRGVIHDTAFKVGATPKVDIDTPSQDNKPSVGIQQSNLAISSLESLNTNEQGHNVFSSTTEKTLLSLPILIAGCERGFANGEEAVNQHRMNHVAAVRFLEALGITDMPVFGLYTDGGTCRVDYSFVESGSRVSLTNFITCVY